MKAFSILFWIRWRLLLHESENNFLLSQIVSRTLVAVLPLLFSMAFGLSFSFILVLTMEHSQELTRRTEWLQNANQFFLIVVLLAFFTRIISSGRLLRQLNSRIIRHYPAGHTTVLLFNLLEGFVDRSYLALGAIMVGFMAGAAILGHAAVVLPTIVLILTNVIVLHVLVEILEELGEAFFSVPTKWKYTVTLIAILGVGALLYGGNIEPRTAINTIVLHSPIRWMNETVYAVGFEGQDYSFTLQYVLYGFLATTLSLFLLITIHEVRTNLDLEKLSKLASKKSRKRIGLIEKLVLVLLPRGIALYAFKDLCYLFRSRRTLVMFLVELIWLAYVLGFASHNETFALRPYVTLHFLSFFPFVFWETYQSNFFGMEQSAFGYYLMTPSSEQRVILAKNISLIMIRTPFILMSWAILLYYFSLSLLPFLISAQIIIFSLLTLSGNANSIRFAYPAARNTRLFSNPPSQSFSLLGFICLVASLCVPIMISIIHWRLGEGASALAVLFMVSIIALDIYRRRLSVTSELFKERGEKLYHKLVHQ